MARRPRFDLPGIAQHIMQRGNDRQACFAGYADYLHRRQEPAEAVLKHGCQLHAYVLMTNHVRLLVTPGESSAAARMLPAIGRRYVGCFNPRCAGPAPGGKAATSRGWSTANGMYPPATA